MVNGDTTETKTKASDKTQNKMAQEETEFMRLSELYIQIDPLVSELQDKLLGTGHIHAVTFDNTDYHTLETLVTDMHEYPMPESVNSIDSLAGAGVVPLIFRNDVQGKYLVFALNPYSTLKPFIAQEQRTIRDPDEIIVNYSDIVLPWVRHNLPGFEDVQQGQTQFLLMYGDLFDKLKIWSTNKDERSKFLNRVGEETSARDSFYAIIRTAIKDRASDVHIEQPSEGVCQIRYRIDGVLRKGSHKIRNPRSLIVVSKTDANMDISESRLPQDGAITFEKSVATSQNIPVGYSLRVSTMPTQYGEKVVMRLLHRDKRFDLTDLGYPQDIYQKVLQQISVPYGLILITGPTGSGKTTTLYSILQHLNTEDVNIVTIEEPIEMPLNGINQSQVNRAINWDFSSSLRNYLRQDPDIILVGEIRDGETAKTAMEAAKTGHLVLSTLHTNDAVSSLLRLYELGVANSDLQSSLQCIVAQRLVRSLCNKCKTSYDAKDDINNLLGAEVAQHFFPLYTTPSEHKIPCLDCSDIGYKGRLPITELWVVGDQEKQMIYDGCRDYQKYLSIAMRDGMVPLVVSGIQSVLEGKTTLHEIGKHVPIEHFLKRRDLIVEAINSYFAKFPK